MAPPSRSTRSRRLIGLSRPLPMLSPENTKIFRVTPTVISVLCIRSLTTIFA
jgi:hypothetical protein